MDRMTRRVRVLAHHPTRSSEPTDVNRRKKLSKKIARDPIRAGTHPDVWICLHDLFDAGERQRWVLAVVGGVALCCRNLALPEADKEVVERIAVSDKCGGAGRRGRRGQKGLWLLLRRIRRHCDREGCRQRRIRGWPRCVL